jgi:hypothetical protein
MGLESFQIAQHMEVPGGDMQKLLCPFSHALPYASFPSGCSNVSIVDLL